MPAVRIATRGSALALWQAQAVASALVEGEVDVEIVVVSTLGDRRTDVSLSTLGGKGVFVKEVQAAVLEGRADLAVHSAKDMPAVTPSGLCIAAYLERADPRDVIVGTPLAAVEPGGTIATGSPRRAAQLRQVRPDVEIVDLRGNIATRLARLDDDVDSLVMAAAALQRLAICREDVEPLSLAVMLPQVGQGAIAVECREGDAELRHRLMGLNHEITARCVGAERAFLAELGGDCSLPTGAHAVVGTSGDLVLEGMLSDGKHLVRSLDDDTDGITLGARLARRLVADLAGLSR